MEKISLIQYLPNEILENILIQDCILLQDIINFSSTCSKFRELINNSNKIWKINFKKRWPLLLKIYNPLTTYIWKDDYQKRLSLGLATKNLLNQMSTKFWKKDEISNSDLIEFEQLLQTYPRAYYFLVSEMMEIIHDYDEFDKMTLKYYTQKVLRFIRQYHLKQEWNRFVSLDPKYQILERGATLVAQWCQPLVDVDYETIASQLDALAHVVRARLAPMNIYIPDEKFNEFRSCNIEDNQWSISESNKIINCISHVLFSVHGFNGNNGMYYSAEYSYINKVLEYGRGIPITLTIVFESVARRLGIKCEAVSFPAHILLRWRESYRENDSRCYYIDVFHGGELVTKRDCPIYNPKGVCPMKGLPLAPASTIQIIERMAINLELASRQRTHMNGRGARLRSALELLHLVNPMDITCILHLSRYYMLYNMELDNLLQSLIIMKLQFTDDRLKDQAHHIIQMLEVYEKQLINDSNKEPEILAPKRREQGVKYAVGMVMRHVQFHYRCVIFGWDYECAASPEWIQQMGVDNLNRKHHQPFYNVMVDDGSIRYAAQENLEVCRTVYRNPVNHVESGRYFDRYCMNHFIPNAEKAGEYPEDASVRQKYCNRLDQCWELTPIFTNISENDDEQMQ